MRPPGLAGTGTRGRTRVSPRVFACLLPKRFCYDNELVEAFMSVGAFQDCFLFLIGRGRQVSLQ